jgi:hypothetical protein
MWSPCSLQRRRAQLVEHHVIPGCTPSRAVPLAVPDCAFVGVAMAEQGSAPRANGAHTLAGGF